MLGTVAFNNKSTPSLLMSAGVGPPLTCICFWSRLGFSPSWGVGSAILTFSHPLWPRDLWIVPVDCLFLTVAYRSDPPPPFSHRHALPNSGSRASGRRAAGDLGRSGLMSPLLGSLIWKPYCASAAAAGGRETEATKYSVQGAATDSFICSLNYLFNSSVQVGILGPGSSVSADLSGR